MGQPEVAHVDVAALHAVARQYEAAADIVEGAVRTHLTELAFDGAAAGRMHVARGDSLRTAVDRVVDQLRQWSRAAAEIAAALGASADRYSEADARAARRVGQR
jgi:Excreted virulence factor EspC, type VII ESX diderm